MKKNVRTNDLKTFERTWKYDRFVYWTKKISKFNSKLSFFGQTHEFLNKLKKRYIFTKRAVSQTNFWKKNRSFYWTITELSLSEKTN